LRNKLFPPPGEQSLAWETQGWWEGGRAALAEGRADGVLVTHSYLQARNPCQLLGREAKGAFPSHQ